jgi:hypothetical protein
VNPSQWPSDQGYRYLEINVTRKAEHDVAPGAGHFDLGSSPPGGSPGESPGPSLLPWREPIGPAPHVGDLDLHSL